MFNNNHLDLPALNTWLGEAECGIQGPEYRDYILPLLFYKRLSDVYADEVTRIAKEFGSERAPQTAFAREMVRVDRKLVRVYIPPDYTWKALRASPVDLGERLTTGVREIAKENPELSGIIDILDYNATKAR